MLEFIDNGGLTILVRKDLIIGVRKENDNLCTLLMGVGGNISIRAKYDDVKTELA